MTDRAGLVLALDVGSSSVRAALFALDGRRLPGTITQEPYELGVTPDGGSFVDADLLLGLVERALEEVARQATAPILAVGTSTFWHGLLGRDAAGRPLTPVLTWADRRGAALLPTLSGRLDAAEYHARTGAFLHSSFWPAKLAWLGADLAASWIGPAELILERFTGDASASLSMASGSGLLRLDEPAWDEPALAALALDRGRLPALSDEPRRTSAWAAGRWPLLADAAWAPPLGDGAAANLGSGCSRPGRANLSFGTSGALRVMLHGSAPAPADGLFLYRAAGGAWLLGGSLSNAGNVWAWLEGLLGPLDESLLLAGQDDVLAWPALAGERAPDWRDDATGSISGLSLASGREDLATACMRGVALGFRRVADRLRAAAGPLELVATGGALGASPALAQLLADAIGEPIAVLQDSEASLRGAAVSALLSLGLAEPAAPLPAHAYQPDREAHDRLGGLLARSEPLRHLR